MCFGQALASAASDLSPAYKQKQYWQSDFSLDVLQELAGEGIDQPALAKRLYGAGLGALAQALSIPEPPLPRPRDPNGYYTGVDVHHQHSHATMPPATMSPL